MEPTSNDIQAFRFRLNRLAMKDQGVAAIPFPMMDQLDRFYQSVEKECLNRQLKPSERATWRTLNDALNLSAFLVQPFESLKRQRIAIAPANVSLPQANQIGTVVRQWLGFYSSTTFAREMEQKPDIFKRLLEPIEWKQGWISQEALSLIVPDNPIDPVAYYAIPSLIASALVDRPFEYQGLRVNWRIAQHNRKLCLISQPIQAHLKIDDADERGFFVIRVEFTLRTMPGTGDREPFIDLSLHCRRYIESINSWSTRSTGTILIETPRPVISSWPQRSPVQVPLIFAKKGSDLASAYYRHHVDDFLGALRALPIRKPRELLQNPTSFWNAHDPSQDGYYLVYHEGTYPNHPVETGWPLPDQQAMYQQFRRNLEGLLIPLEPIRKDRRFYRKTTPTAALHIGDLQDRKKVDADVVDGKVISAPNDHLGEQIAKALKEVWLKRRASPQVVLLWFTPKTRDAIRERFDLMTEGHVPLLLEEISPELYQPLVTDQEFDVGLLWEGGPDLQKSRQQYREKMSDYESALTGKRKKRVSQWTSKLRGIRNKSTLPGSPTDPPEILVLIELPKHKDTKAEEMRSPKGAIREACIQTRFLSQFIVTVEHPEKSPDREDGKPVRSDFYRVENALTDLVLRQTGITIGSWQAFHQRLETSGTLPEAELIGLYRATTNKYNLDFPVAVRLTPSGRHAEMTFPEKNGTWLPYPQACAQLAEIVVRNRYKIISRKIGQPSIPNDVCLARAQILAFVDEIIRGPGKEKIVFLEALHFRQQLMNHLRNGDMKLNQYPIPGNGTLAPSQLPGVRLVRILIGESPQYIMAGPEPKEPGNALLEAGKYGDFDVFYSIGENATVNKQLVHETTKTAEFRHPETPDDRDPISKQDYARRAFKHSQMVEIVPYFMQPGDDPAELAWIAHRLRTALNWSAGNTLYPRPIHLASAFFADMTSLYEADDGEDEP
ncbi:MAG: RNaseH domain-containing protein [Anaerolineaceae bacterium]|nr:RNaseH domain-containing protein [Anaerolineaceae bacterium]